MWPWIGISLFVALMLALDLGILNRRPHVISMKEALTWFCVWVGAALFFNLGIIFFHERGMEAGLEFFAGFLVEKSLSIDNVFVFVIIFNYFQVPPVHQHKVLALGIIGAFVVRLLFILGGLALLERFHWMLYVFSVFLIATGLMMLFRRESEFKPGEDWRIRTFLRFFSMADHSEDGKFFVRMDGRYVMTPLFVTLIAIESCDIIFATDSIPAIFAITTDPFIVFSSNIFAMLGLRALYFAVQGFTKMFYLLHYGFALIILVLGVKLALSDVYKPPITLSLFLIALILLICVVFSLLHPRKQDLKLLFERTEQLGLIPFRRLLMIENVIDLGDLKVQDSMRMRADVKSIRLDLPWQANLQLLNETHFSRYPLVEEDGGKPIGVVHIKNIPFGESCDLMTASHIRSLARSSLKLRESLALEEALARFQRRFDRLALVYNDEGDWTGILTFEDLIQEIVGNMGDEFDQARAGEFVSLADALSVDRVILDLRAESFDEAVAIMISKIPKEELSADPKVVTNIVLRRKQLVPFYVGDGIAIPHGRMAGIRRPILIFARCDLGVAIHESNERAVLIFVLITPSDRIRMQPRMLATINALFKSEYVSSRLRKCQTPEAVVEAIRAGQQVAID